MDAQSSEHKSSRQDPPTDIHRAVSESPAPTESQDSKTPGELKEKVSLKFFAFIIRKHALDGIPRGYTEGMPIMMTATQVQQHKDWVLKFTIPAPWLNGELEITTEAEKMKYT